MSETGTTLTIELVGVCIALAAGFVHMLESWPSPWVPVVWMGAVFVLFTGYRIGLFVRQKYFPAPEPEESPDQQTQAAARAKKLSLKWSAVEPNVPTKPSGKGAQADGPLHIPDAEGDFASAELATMGIPEVALGEGSEDPTAFLDEQAIRPETDTDISKPESATIPLFAESTMSIDERTLAMQAIEVGDGTADSEGPTAPMDAVSEPAGVEPEKTEALSEAGLSAQMDEEGSGVAKTMKTQGVSAPRKPFENTKKPAANDPSNTPASEPAPAKDVQPPTGVDGVQMFDAEELRKMQEQLEREKNGGDE